MNSNETDIELRPSPLFATIKTLPFLLFSSITMTLAYLYLPVLIFPSLFSGAFALYRYIYIRRAIYLVTAEYIRISRGIFYKRTDTVELFRVKDYIVTQPLLLRFLKLMDLQLKTIDAENPILWLRGIPQTNIIDILRDRIQLSRQTNHIIELS